MDTPDADDYMELFRLYGGDFSSVYLAEEDERYRLLFDQICKLLAKPSAFNLSLPPQFRRTAMRWLDGDPHTVTHMRVIENRHFMLSDLFDYIDLVRRVGTVRG